MFWQYLIIIAVLLLISLVIIKMRRNDFHVEINKLIQYLGGKENILDAQINLSRLRVTLKDTSIVNKEGIQKMGAQGIVEVENQLKIIFGEDAKQLKKCIDDLM